MTTLRASFLWVTRALLGTAILVLVQLLVYATFHRPAMARWGATGEEAKRPLVGDELAPSISSTRAIDIDAPSSEVWRWIVQLGADRGGWFSYGFLETALGYRPPPPVENARFEMEVGRVVPTSLDPAGGAIPFSFRVLSVVSGESFVLQGWGAFVLRRIDAQHTRLIVRTHAQPTPTMASALADFVMFPLHYIMERRMLLGLKAKAEGRPLSQTKDLLWFAGIVIAGIPTLCLAASSRSRRQTAVALVLGALWLWPLLTLDPTPLPALALAALALAAAIGLWRSQTRA